MCQLTIRLLVALLTFTIGTTAGLLWNALGPAQLPDAAVPAPALPAVTDFPPRAAAPARLVSGGVLNGYAVSKPAPAYPPVARAARVEGTVVVQVTVDESGEVVTAYPAGGHPLLQQAAVAAARRAEFVPTRLGGRPVRISGVLTYNFVLQ